MRTFKNSRVAVLGDGEFVRGSLTDTMRSWGLLAEDFSRPGAALDNIRENKCDVILLDVSISSVCNLDLVPQFAGDLKIIVITGSADRQTAIRALKLGAFDWLERPFENELLYHSISRALMALKNERESKRLIDDLEKTRSELLTHQQLLENTNTQLLETNRAVSVFAQNIDREREEIEKQIASKLRNLMMPLVVKLRDDQNFHKHQARLDMLTRQIEDLTSGFAPDSSVAMTLSSTEMQVASLINNGIKTEEIARHLHISENTVRSHRKNIRKKLKIDNAQYSLRDFITSKIREQSNADRSGLCLASK